MVTETLHNTVTLAFGGDIPVPLYARAVDNLGGLVETLTTNRVRKNAFEWFVDESTALGKAITLLADIDGEADLHSIDDVVDSYGKLGVALEHGGPITGYSDQAIKHARAITSILNGRIRSVRFETAKVDATILSDSAERTMRRMHLGSYGSIEGRVQALSNRRSLRFMLYETLTGRGVTCYLDAEKEEMILGVWGRRVVVEGWISRDPLTGQAINIREIDAVVVLDAVEPGSYKQARGVLRDGTSDEEVSQIIQRVRDPFSVG